MKHTTGTKPDVVATINFERRYLHKNLYQRLLSEALAHLTFVIIIEQYWALFVLKE